MLAFLRLTTSAMLAHLHQIVQTTHRKLRWALDLADQIQNKLTSAALVHVISVVTSQRYGPAVLRVGNVPVTRIRQCRVRVDWWLAYTTLDRVATATDKQSLKKRVEW